MRSHHVVLTMGVRLLMVILGRRRLAQISRLMTNEARLDTANDLEVNGENLVRLAALRACNPVVLDIGGHFGEWSEALLSASRRDQRLFVFEPSAFSAEVARTRLGLRASVIQTAMSDHRGSGSLHIVHNGAGSNSVVPFEREGWQENPGAIESIEFDTVDSFCSDHEIDHVTLIKIDAEGHDLAVMRGASNMLAGNLIDMVQFEYNHRWIDSRTFLLDAFNLLTPHGYVVGKVTRLGVEVYEHWHPELEKFVEANYLAYLPGSSMDIDILTWWGP